ncbi:MAG: glycogen synthase, partial [Olpidium bornovanus]
GGVYTVIKSKVPVTVEEYGDRYCLIGPLNRNLAAVEGEAVEPPPSIKAALDPMSAQGTRYLYGRWLTEGAPEVLLFDLDSMRHRTEEWRGDIYRVASIPSPDGDFEMNNAIVFGYLVAWFLGEYLAKETSRAVIAHYHEWLAAVGLILGTKRDFNLTSIFTTHATLLGRYLCAGSVDFYNGMQYFDVDQEAGRRNIYHRYCVERAAAHCATVFTTVSHITGCEAEHLLKRRPDGVVPNGLNVVKFSAMHEFQNLHAINKEKIHAFVQGHFYGHMDFDLDNTLYFFTAGRYEFRNKGVDMYINALKRLNDRLIVTNSKTTVVAFIVLPARTRGLSVEALKGQAVVKQLRDTVTEIQARIGKRLFDAASSGANPEEACKMSEEDKVILKRRILALKRDTLPSIVTHDMEDDANDEVINELRALHMFNRPEDRVKIVFHPEFINANSPLFGMDYEDFVRGCHLGVFPSYYEPWGYTPAECTVMGVPNITTNLAGYGCFIEDRVERPSDYGVYIVDRRLKNAEESQQQLADQMFHFCCKTRRQRINQRNRTERLSELLDWKRMGLEYVRARDVALRRKWPEVYEGGEDEWSSEAAYGGDTKIPRPMSVPSSPRVRSKFVTRGGDDDVNVDGESIFFDAPFTAGLENVEKLAAGLTLATYQKS